MNLIQLLNSLPNEYGLKVANDKAFIRCPFHRNNGQLERTPSFIINLSDSYRGKAGTGYCFGCGRYAKWEDLAKALKISGNIEFDPSVYVVKQKEQRKQTIFRDWPINQEWRGISGKLLHKLHCKHYTANQIDWMRIPVMQNEEERGYIDARVFRPSKKVLGYINSPGTWTHSTLFGIDYASDLDEDFVVVVEGPRDCLNLLQYNVPAVAVLGAQNINKLKVEILLSKWSLIVAGFDGDDAGHRAVDRLYELINKRARLHRLQFEEGTDPADLTKQECKTILDMYRE